MESNNKEIRHLAMIMGARPNFIKAASLCAEVKNHPEFKLTLIHTGQHFDKNMSDIFFEEMRIPRPQVTLNIMADRHSEKIGRMFNSLQATLSELSPDGVLVFGDVNSTLAGALASAKNRIPLIHVEAGLRSHDRRMPEEINRVIVDHLSDVLFTTEPSADENLKREGIDPSRIHHVGNLMIESLERYRDDIDSSRVLDTVNHKDYFIATIHRQENTDDRTSLERVLFLLDRISRKKPVIFPLHPGTRKKIEGYGLSELLSNLSVIEPLGYFDFIKLVQESSGVITDSGGIQEETTHLGVPCATLRDNTERPITVEAGSNRLFDIRSISPKEILLHFSRSYPARPIPLWDDKVSKRIFKSLHTFFK
ncbi:MAG: UDP-N-acetylglucosamine 2-epimerase (non-hydrolyzing) [Candidatus Paceibacterota bacterium]|jgi:UDP-N-acetylglucosamine 2-epimerase (non-hydrolysing)